MTICCVNRRFLYLELIIGIFSFFAALSAFGQGTAFFYQGQLGSGGAPANGYYDFKFTLYDAASNGVPASGSLTNDSVAVSNGLFTTTLDFGTGIFTGPSLWLDIGISTNGTNFTMLSPLQPVLPVPYAIFANSASNLLGNLSATQLSGTLPATAFAGYTNTVALTNGANLFSGTFSGNGGSVTNVNVTNLTGVLADSQLPTNTAYLNSNQTFTANNTFSGANTFTNFSNSFYGSFFGNGLVGWIPVPGTSVQAQIDHGYVLTNSLITTVTLPISTNVGDIVRVAGAGAGGWMLAQNAGQSVLGNFLSYGASWTKSGASAVDWTGIASSSDGTKMAASGYDNQIYLSTDSGLVWSSSSADNGSAIDWTGVASSSDGTRLVAVAADNGIYLSTNSGSSWAIELNSSADFSCVASSSSGNNMVAAINGGDIDFSPNAGASWFLAENSGGATLTSESWVAVASSSSGSLMVAAYNGGIYSSSDYGTNWSATGAPNKNWTCIAMSASGSRFIAAATSGGVYISTNLASTSAWVEQTSLPENIGWTGVACSSDGSKLVAVASSSGIYTSSNWGMTWHTNTILTASWSCVASSSSGSTLAAGIDNTGTSGLSGIYASPAASQTVTTTGTSGYVIGSQGSAAELQYIGNSQWMPVSSSGTLWAQ
jgi:hypothetical protein